MDSYGHSGNQLIASNTTLKSNGQQMESISNTKNEPHVVLGTSISQKGLDLAVERFYKNETANKRPVAADLEKPTSVPPQQEINKKRKLTSYSIPEVAAELSKEIVSKVVTEFPGIRDLQYVHPCDAIYFRELLQYKKSSECSEDEKKLRTVLKLILRVKNGTSQNRKLASKQMADHCNALGISLVFDKLLPILLERTLSEQERYILIKLLNKLVVQFQAGLEPYVYKILIIVSPLLVDEDQITKSLGCEVVATIAKLVGPACIITTVRQDIDNEDISIRNLTANILAICSKSIGLQHFIPFIHAMCQSRQKWENRFTGVKTIHFLATSMGISVLPYLNYLLQCMDGRLDDEQILIRIATANAIGLLATSSNSHGIESFEKYALESLGNGIKQHRGKLLGSFLRALSNILPMMNLEYANYYGKYVLSVVKREMSSPDSEMTKVVLLSLQRCIETSGLMTIKYYKEDICPDFFDKFWTRRIALDLQLNKLVNYTTVLLAKRIGPSFIVTNLISHLKDTSEPSRVMTVFAIKRIFDDMGDELAGISPVLETQLIDGLLIAFQDQKSDTQAFVSCFGTVSRAFGERMSKFLPPIISTVLNTIKNKNPIYRQLAADLCNEMIPQCYKCGETDMLLKLNIILFEALGEPYPEVLGSVLNCMNSIIKVTPDLSTLQPPISQLLPTLTPVLRNVHPKVNDNILKLIDHIAVRSADLIPPKEWMRVRNELIDMLKSPRKSVRIQANETFGNIAKTIGPQEILVSLLNNLKVQERQLRLCSSIAVAIVAKKCGTYTVLPALMNEYKTPDIHVQNGILKALAFLFEYIGPLGSDYIYMVVPLLQDALTDRDLVHRQTASTILKNIAIACKGAGKDDFFVHLLDLLIPNIFETSPHAISRILGALDGVRVALGPSVFMQYIWAGLFHSSRKVRVAYWEVYNSAYIHEGDNLVHCYPDIEGQNVDELEYIL